MRDCQDAVIRVIREKNHNVRDTNMEIIIALAQAMDKRFDRIDKKLAQLEKDVKPKRSRIYGKKFKMM